MSLKSPSCERTLTPRSRPRRETIFERKEIVESLTPVVIAAIQRELNELREEFEHKLQVMEERADRRVRDLLQLASDERIDMEKLRLANGERWETATGSTAQSRSSKAK